MVEPFKNMIGRAAVGRLAQRLGLDRRFVRAATTGLEALELKARVAHVAGALRAHLPPDYETALARIVDGLPPPLPDAEGVGAGFWLWPLCHFVEAHGLDHPVASLAAMPALTQRFSCEFAIRPFVERHRELTFAQLADWVADPNVHVRRLVSEGTRPRLPWGRRLTALQRDPRPLWPLLERLRDDPELYVRRSVANSLNDVAKDHPALAVEVANRWLADAPPGREWIVRHALRTLIKQGDRSALRALGYGTAKVDAVRFEVAPRRLALGDALTLRAELRSTARSEQQLVIDYAVHHRRQNGTLSPKVFKWRRAALPVGGTLELEKRHALRPVTTRRYHAGRHRVELLVNGRSCGSRDFDLRL